MQESVLWLHAITFLLCAGWTLQLDKHVRVDVFYRQFSARAKARVDAIGSLVFLLPVAGYMLYGSLPYVIRSWNLKEASVESGGLPGLYLLKALIPLAALILLLQGVVIIVSKIHYLRHAKLKSG